MTGGCYISGKEVEVVSQIIESIRQHTGLEKVPGIVNPAPAKGDNIQRYYDIGIGALGFSMEVWDETFFKAICPGKSSSTSHDEFVESITQAVEIFGKGNVYVAMVMGLEPKETFLEGIKVLSGIGANVIPFVWAPIPDRNWKAIVLLLQSGTWKQSWKLLKLFMKIRFHGVPRTTVTYVMEIHSCTTH